MSEEEIKERGREREGVRRKLRSEEGRGSEEEIKE